MRQATFGAVAFLAVLAAVPAGAAPIRFDGQGTITDVNGALPRTGSVALGDAFTFSFVFDLDDASPISISPDFASYELPFTAFTATFGDYVFVPEGVLPGLEPVARLGIFRGFGALGGNVPESIRAFDFSFIGRPGTGAPFTGSNFETFGVVQFDRDSDPSRPVSLADVRDPSAAAQRIAFYQSLAPQSPDVGALAGMYSGGFAALTGAVPEPASWALLITGFGLLGAAARRRRTQLSYA